MKRIPTRMPRSTIRRIASRYQVTSSEDAIGGMVIQALQNMPIQPTKSLSLSPSFPLIWEYCNMSVGQISNGRPPRTLDWQVGDHDGSGGARKGQRLPDARYSLWDVPSCVGWFDPIFWAAWINLDHPLMSCPFNPVLSLLGALTTALKKHLRARLPCHAYSDVIWCFRGAHIASIWANVEEASTCVKRWSDPSCPCIFLFTDLLTSCVRSLCLS